MQNRDSRFIGPSHGLALGGLLRKARGGLAVSLLVTLLAHLAFTRISFVAQSQSAAKPLTTQFVKRQPRLTKPLELKKLPRPKERLVQRKMVTVKARTTRAGVGTRPLTVAGLVGNLTQPMASLSRFSDEEPAVFEPGAVATAVQGSMESEHRVDLSLELVDVGALDTGRYHAMVVQDPNDKRNIKGYFHFIQAYPVSVVAERGQINEYATALRNLIHKLNEFTDIRADVERNVPFSSEEIFKVPFIYFDFGDQSGLGRLSPAEATRLGEYMLLGGLYMAEDGWPGLGSPTDKAARATIEDALAAVGMLKDQNWTYVKIPNSHAIYHVYYDFASGPPPGGDTVAHPGSISGPFPWLEGVFMGDRLMAIMSNKSYQDVWATRAFMAAGEHVNLFLALQPRAIQMGINIIIFALTQEGSITRRVMDTVQY